MKFNIKSKTNCVKRKIFKKNCHFLEKNFVSSFYRVPVSFCWDNEDSRIVACETRRLVQPNEKRPPTSMGTMRPKEPKSSPTHGVMTEQEPDSQVFILFPTNDVRNLIKSMEILDLEFGEQLIAMHTPYVVRLQLFLN